MSHNRWLEQETDILVPVKTPWCRRKLLAGKIKGNLGIKEEMGTHLLDHGAYAARLFRGEKW